MACVVGDPVEESFIGLVTKAGERRRRAAATIANFRMLLGDSANPYKLGRHMLITMTWNMTCRASAGKPCRRI